MPREFDLIGLGNSLVDILLELTDAEFSPLGFEKGTMRLTEHDEQQKLLKAFADHEIEVWRTLTIVVDSGELRPGHLRARKPARAGRP